MNYFVNDLRAITGKHWFAAGILCLCLLILQHPAQAADTGAPNILADSAILVEVSTGRVVYEKNADIKRPPASLTKMMTCILGLEKIDPHAVITVSPVAAATEYSALDLHTGDTMEAEQMLRGMMLVSDNGAAVAVAEHIAGSVPLFAGLMNEKAAEIGCEHTHFANPNGLTAPKHYSTARDMAKIAVYAMHQERFRDIVNESLRWVYWTTPKGRWIDAENTNELLGEYEGANGIKTGWTEAAGGCLAASAKRGNVELIAIVLHSPSPDSRFEDAKKLLDYGFQQVRVTSGLNKDRVEASVWVKNGTSARLAVGLKDDVNYPLLNGETPEHYRVSYKLPRIVEGGIHQGQKVGEAVLLYDGEPVAKIPMIARENVPKGFSISSCLVGLVAEIFSVAGQPGLILPA